MARFSPEAERLVQEGIEAARAGQNDSARKLLHEVVQLEPMHEQAWLWLSGVEATQAEKVAALKQVLQINPQNAAAKRGLERLEPSKLDLSAVVSSYAAPAPARVTKTEEPTLPPRPLPQQPATLPQQPLQNQSALPQQPPTLPQQPLQNQSALPQQPPPLQPPLPVSQAEPERSVGLESLEGLRPAIQQAQKRRITFLPRTSELIIMAFLFVGLVGAWFFIRSALNRASVSLDGANLQGRAPTSAAVVQPPQQQPPGQAEQPPVLEPTPAEDVVDATAAPVFSGATFRSQSYSLSVGGTTIDQDARTVTVNVSVINPLNQTLQVRSNDFMLRNAINDPMVLDPGASTLFAEAASLPAQATVQGTLVFSGDVFRSPFQMTWQPTNGNVSQSITVR